METPQTHYRMIRDEEKRDAIWNSFILLMPPIFLSAPPLPTIPLPFGDGGRKMPAKANDFSEPSWEIRPASTKPWKPGWPRIFCNSISGRQLCGPSSRYRIFWRWTMSSDAKISRPKGSTSQQLPNIIGDTVFTFLWKNC